MRVPGSLDQVGSGEEIPDMFGKALSPLVERRCGLRIIPIRPNALGRLSGRSDTNFAYSARSLRSSEKSSWETLLLGQ